MSAPSTRPRSVSSLSCMRADVTDRLGSKANASTPARRRPRDRPRGDGPCCRPEGQVDILVQSVARALAAAEGSEHIPTRGPVGAEGFVINQAISAFQFDGAPEAAHEVHGLLRGFHLPFESLPAVIDQAGGS